jgi:hypothetical protein
MNFKKWVKSIQTAAYNGARTVDGLRQSKAKLSLIHTKMDRISTNTYVSIFDALGVGYFFNRSIQERKLCIMCNSWIRDPRTCYWNPRIGFSRDKVATKEPSDITTRVFKVVADHNSLLTQIRYVYINE